MSEQFFLSRKVWCRKYGNYKIEEILITKREINRKDMREKEKRKITKGEVTKITEGEKQNKISKI